MRRETIQFIRFGIVGVCSNLLLLLLYLLLTRVGVGHKSAMTVLYVVGVLQTFVFNRRWSFNHEGSVSIALRRYCIVYALGYLFNLGMLFVLVDRLGLPHEVIQACLILVLAVLLFLGQKYWVFRPVQGSIILTSDK